MLTNERLVRVKACMKKLAWLPPESKTVPFCNISQGRRSWNGNIVKIDEISRYETYNSRDLIHFLPGCVTVLGTTVELNQPSHCFGSSSSLQGIITSLKLSTV